MTRSLAKSFSCVLLLLPACHVSAQRWCENADSLHRARVLMVTAGEAAVYGGSLAGLYGLWYSQYDQEPFHFFDDWTGWLQMDKVGHTATAYQSGLQLYYTHLWAGMPQKRAMAQAVATSFSYQFAVEMLDGFSSGWGFSATDLAANSLGSATLLGQHLLWREQRIYWKYSFWPSGLTNRPGEEGRRARNLFGSSLQEQWLKDYNGQTYWLSMNIWSLSGKPKTVPRWLNLAVGYSTDNMLGAESNSWLDPSGMLVHSSLQRQRQWLLSLDIDLYRVSLPCGLRWLKPVFGVIKLPFPALEFSDGKWQGHWLYF